jgi:hypothetical protein
MYANITNPANFQLQDFAQFGFRVITTDFIPVPGEQYRTLYVLQDAVVTATTQKGDDITSKAILAGTLLHGLFNSVSITSGRVLAYAAGRVTADEIIALYESYVSALGGTLENTQCAIDTLNDTGVDFFADASLVMIPEGYATGVVYGQRPLTSDSQLTFTRASTATRVGPDGAIAVVGSNVPRIDYTGGGCGKLLLEPQRTNLLLYSEEFDNAAWTKSNTTISANATTSPDGYVNADKLIGDSGAGAKYISASIVTPSGVNDLATSFFVKASGVNYIVLRNNTNAGSVTNCTFNVSTGENTYNGMTGTPAIEALSDGWYKVTCVNSSSTAATRYFRLYLSDVNVDSNTEPSYTGDGTSGVYIYGAQLEAGAYATSYIPTTAAAVTRLADACSKTGIASLIGQTEGTIFVDLAGFDGNTHLVTLGDGTISNYLMLYISSGSIAWLSNSGLSGSAGSVTATSKVALAYKENDSVLYLDGTQVLSDTSNTIPSLPNMYLNNNATLSNVLRLEAKQVTLFNERLSNAQLAELTTI